MLDGKRRELGTPDYVTENLGKFTCHGINGVQKMKYEFVELQALILSPMIVVGVLRLLVRFLRRGCFRHSRYCLKVVFIIITTKSH